jgi:hypothetical protein
MLARGAYFLRARFPLAITCIKMVLTFAVIGFLGYALLPVIGY